MHRRYQYEILLGVLPEAGGACTTAHGACAPTAPKRRRLLIDFELTGTKKGVHANRMSSSSRICWGASEWPPATYTLDRRRTQSAALMKSIVVRCVIGPCLAESQCLAPSAMRINSLLILSQLLIKSRKSLPHAGSKFPEPSSTICSIPFRAFARSDAGALPCAVVRPTSLRPALSST